VLLEALESQSVNRPEPHAWREQSRGVQIPLSAPHFRRAIAFGLDPIGLANLILDLMLLETARQCSPVNAQIDGRSARLITPSRPTGAPLSSSSAAGRVRERGQRINPLPPRTHNLPGIASTRVGPTDAITDNEPIRTSFKPTFCLLVSATHTNTFHSIRLGTVLWIWNARAIVVRAAGGRLQPTSSSPKGR
jgi:hypothetical protein